jgi:hypothetical protein
MSTFTIVFLFIITLSYKNLIRMIKLPDEVTDVVKNVLFFKFLSAK